MLWRPLSRSGPIEVETELRVMTLVELSKLPKLIDAGKYVLLALGPCGACGRDKGSMLKTILDIKPPLITHVVVDSLSAGQAFPKS